MNIVINRFLKTFLIICMVLVSIILNASFQAWAGEVVVTVETPDDKYLTFDDIYKTRIPPNGWENTMWNDPGGWITIDVTDNGLPPNSPSIDATIAIQSIINSSSGNRILYFPQGTYYFQTPLTINVGNIRFMGEGVNYTIFKISGMSSQNVQITFSGEVSGSPISVVGSPAPGDNIIIVSDASTLNVGDIIQLYAEYPPLENRGLAWGDCRIYGQFLKIIDKNGETLMLDMKIGLPYDSSYKPKVQKYNMLSNIGFEKIKIIRDNQTDDEKKSNVYFRYVYNSFISDNEMKYAPRNHIGINNSKDIVVERNYLHDTFITNAGGSGYGVLVIASTGCRITDNKTANLRHHIILHTGANHNVVSYNSLEPSYYSYNDLSLHAVYPYMNLIEGNTFYEGYADNSKESTGVEESSGPYNTWFRNFSVGGIGILQSTTDKQNILGNYLGIVLDSMGLDHYIGANVKDDVIMWGDFEESVSIPASLYLTSKPHFLDNKPWPLFGPDVPNYGKRNTLPAKDRLFINDNFDMLIEGAAPEGWSITSNGGTVEIVDVSDSDNKSLKLNKTDDALGTKVDINKKVGPINSIVTFEFKFKREETEGWWCVPYIFSSSNKMASTMVLVDGNIKINGSGTWTDIQSFMADIWYTVRMEMDINRNRMDIYINGNLKKSNITFREKVDDIRKIVFYATGTTIGTLYLDDIKLFKGKRLYSLMDFNFDMDAIGRNPGGKWLLDLAGGDITINDETAEFGNNLHMNCTSDNILSIKRHFTEKAGEIYIEYRIRRNNTSGWWAGPYIYQKGVVAQSIAFADGNIKYHNSSNWVNVQSFEPNIWYYIKLKINTDTSRFDMYVNGEKKVDNAFLRNTVDAVNTIEFYTSGGIGSTYIDDIMVYSDNLMDDDMFNFRIDKPIIRYTDGSNVDNVLIGNKTVSIKSKVYDKSACASVTLISALYKKNQGIVKIDIDYSPSQKKEYMLNTEISLPDNVEEHYIKVFVWDGLSSIKPLKFYE